MNLATRTVIQKANAWFLLVAGGLGFANDIRGVFFGEGPVATVVKLAPHTGIGFIEAHGLAFIIGALLLLSAPERRWHLAAAATHLLLGASNISCWPFFAAADAMMVGYVSTALHIVFFALQSAAAVSYRDFSTYQTG